MIIQGVP
jgi:hypothetical protein